jgi:hypothetical protein
VSTDRPGIPWIGDVQFSNNIYQGRVYQMTFKHTSLLSIADTSASAYFINQRKRKRSERMENGHETSHVICPRQTMKLLDVATICAS